MNVSTFRLLRGSQYQLKALLEPTALRDFDPADVGSGSFSTKSSNSAYELMSASTPIATTTARRCDM
jgi:hypothetical protein